MTVRQLLLLAVPAACLHPSPPSARGQAAVVVAALPLSSPLPKQQELGQAMQEGFWLRQQLQNSLLLRVLQLRKQRRWNARHRVPLPQGLQGGQLRCSLSRQPRNRLAAVLRRA
jgi:hypothetical protein